MERKGKYFNTIYISSVLITLAGIVLVLAKVYSYIGLLLLFFGGLIFLHALGARRKEIITDEMTEWISGKAANLSYMVTLSAITVLLAIDIYIANIFETYIALGIVMLAAVIARAVGEYYYEKVHKNLGS
ncbi:MAG: hypothetical protein D4R88_06220 [Methanosarcinales archaeon]|nr:MAG: hypothetical protein D4R88_06220 [Methanosarcinales archaeon]